MSAVTQVIDLYDTPKHLLAELQFEIQSQKNESNNDWGYYQNFVSPEDLPPELSFVLNIKNVCGQRCSQSIEPKYMCRLKLTEKRSIRVTFEVTGYEDDSFQATGSIFLFGPVIKYFKVSDEASPNSQAERYPEISILIAVEEKINAFRATLPCLSLHERAFSTCFVFNRIHKMLSPLITKNDELKILRDDLLKTADAELQNAFYALTSSTL